MAYCLFLSGDTFDRDAWIEDVDRNIVCETSGTAYPLSPLCLQWTQFGENLEEGEAWLHPVGGIRGVTVRKENDGITLSIPSGNSPGDFGLAWELMRLGVKYGAEASGEGKGGVISLSLSAEETERITREITAFHRGTLYSLIQQSEGATLPVGGQFSLELDSENCAGGAEAMEQRLIERMNRYSQAFAASLMSVSKDGAVSQLSVYSQIPTVVDARTELIHLSGDNLPPDIANAIQPLKAEFVYDLLDAERLGEYIYLPPPPSEFTLHALIALATSPINTAEHHPDIPRPAIPAPDVVSAGNEMTGTDWATLAKSPCLVFLLIASADGSIDKKELIQFGKLLKNHTKMPTPIIRKILNITANNVAGIFESMGEINPGIALIEVGVLLQSGKLPAADSSAISTFLCKLGEEIASASGGFFGFGSKISKKESEILAALKKLLSV